MQKLRMGKGKRVGVGIRFGILQNAAVYAVIREFYAYGKGNGVCVLARVCFLGGAFGKTGKLRAAVGVQL